MQYIILFAYSLYTYNNFVQRMFNKYAYSLWKGRGIVSDIFCH